MLKVISQRIGFLPPSTLVIYELLQHKTRLDVMKRFEVTRTVNEGCQIVVHQGTSLEEAEKAYLFLSNAFADTFKDK